MTEKEYISAIATIVSDYRKKELDIPLDENHVAKWLDQFEESERYIVIKEMFQILSRNYIKAEKIEMFLTQIIEKVKNDSDGLENVAFLNLQTKGKSQDLFCEMVKDICKNEYEIDCKIITSEQDIGDEKIYVYIDDGMYTGYRSAKDILPLITNILPEGTSLKIYYMVAYSNAFFYYESKFRDQARNRNIAISFEVGQYKNNDRNVESSKIDFIWPEEKVNVFPEVAAYEKKLKQTGKANYLYDPWAQGSNPGMFTDYESRESVEAIFLKYGIRIANKIGRSTYRPLGISNTPSFGFGSIYITDFNISNTCPLVLWWGNLADNTDDPIGCWYPLFPRRTNNMVYQEIEEHEMHYSLDNYKSILSTVYRLAQEEKQKNCRVSKESFIDLWDIDLDEIVNRRERSNLLQYMRSLNMDQIKVIQTVMYMGRDYEYPSYSEEEWEELWIRMSEDPEYVLPEKKVKVDNPDELLLSWMDYLDFSKGWTDKDIEIDQIYQKAPLAQYLNRAFDILGL